MKTDLGKALNLVPTTLFLREGLPVMFTVNSERFVNGTQGFIREVRVDPRVKYEPGGLDDDVIVVGVPQREGPEMLIELRRWAFARNHKEAPDEFVTVVDPETGEQKQAFRFPVIRHFPLIPASAITVHKSQGMSLDRACLALSKSLAAGQVYVGLSRLRTSEGMVLTSLDFEAQVDPQVMAYYHQLANDRERRLGSRSEAS